MRIVCVMAHAKTYMRHVFRVINLMLLNNSFMPASFLENLFSIAFVLADTHNNMQKDVNETCCRSFYIHIERTIFFVILRFLPLLWH